MKEKIWLTKFFDEHVDSGNCLFRKFYHLLKMRALGFQQIGSAGIKSKAKEEKIIF